MADRMNSYFPSQKIATSAKNKEWFKKCIDAGIDSTSMTGLATGHRTYYQKKLLRDLENGIIDPIDVETTTNYVPVAFGTKTLDKIQNYPLSKPRIDLLVGESIKRRYDWMVKVVNDDAISEKEKALKKLVTKAIYEMALTPDMNDKAKQEKLNELGRWEYYEYQDMRERMGSQILQYLWKEQELPIKFMDGVSNGLNIGEEFYCIDIIGNDPRVRVVDPLTLRYLRNGNSWRLEDSDIIVEDTYMPIGQVIDTYYDFLTSSQVSAIEEGYGTMDTNELSPERTNTYPAMQSDWFADANQPSNDLISFFTSTAVVATSGPYDSNGNIRVARVVWKGMRKIGIVTVFDDNGIEQTMLVDENYKVNKSIGEKVKWVWISEWYEGTRIGKDIYVKMMPRPIQFRRVDNLSASASGYVGTIYPQSLLEIMKPYQYLYVLVLEELKKAIRKFKAPQIEIDLAKIPDGWKLDQWLYYAEEMGYLVVDSFKEGDKGLSQGKMAGQYNTTGKVYNPDMGNYIQHLQLILQFIERQVAIISGVSDQRLGQIENRETVGGVERSVQQSSNITERIFAMHDNTRSRVLELLLETAKYAWRNQKSKKVQYILDDMSSYILNFDPGQLNEADYGIFTGNTSNDTELMSGMKQLAHALIQTDKINVKDLMTILTSPSISAMRRELERSESERQKLLQQQTEQQNQIEQQKIQAMMQAEQQKVQLEDALNQRDNDTKILVATIQAESKGNETTTTEATEVDALAEEETLAGIKEREEKLSIARDQLNETKRHNMATEAISRIAKSRTPTSK